MAAMMRSAHAATAGRLAPSSASVCLDLPVDVRPETYEQSHPQLSAVLADIFAHLSASSALLSSLSPSPRLSSQLHQHKQSYYRLTLLHHHISLALSTHAVQFPALTSLRAQHEVTAVIRSEGDDGRLLGVTAADVARKSEQQAQAQGWTEGRWRQERRRLDALVAESIQAQLDTARSLCDDQDTAADKENSDTAASTAPSSSTFLSLISPPSQSHSPAPPCAVAGSGVLQSHVQQAVSHELALLSLYSSVISDQRLSVHAEHDAQLTRYLKAKLDTLSSKQRLLHHNATQTALKTHSPALWHATKTHLDTRARQLTADLDGLQRRLAMFTALDTGREADEWRRVKVAWKDVQRRREEKRWALKQLS